MTKIDKRILTRRTVLIGGAALTLTACATERMPARYSGPMADGILVHKGERAMFLLDGQEVMSRHAIDLGFAPVGHKEQEGDGRTPEGFYRINRRNDNSAFFRSLGISYPNRQDIARAEARGVKPGGDIFIHGEARDDRKGRPDWTAGCIAISDREMAQIYPMVPLGTPIWIKA